MVSPAARGRKQINTGNVHTVVFPRRSSLGRPALSSPAEGRRHAQRGGGRGEEESVLK